VIDNIIRQFWLNAFKGNKCWQRGLDRGSFDYFGLRCLGKQEPENGEML